MVKCEIKIIEEVTSIFPKYQPKVGQIYKAILSPGYLIRVSENSSHGKAEFCIIDVLDKKIALRKGEYEIVRYCNG